MIKKNFITNISRFFMTFEAHAKRVREIRKLFRFKSSSTISIRTDRRRRIIDWPAKTFGKSLFSRSTRVHKLHECQLSLPRLGLWYRERQTTKFPRDESSSRLFTSSLLRLGYCQAEEKRKQFRRSEINFHRSFSLSCRAIRALN